MVKNTFNIDSCLLNKYGSIYKFGPKYESLLYFGIFFNSYINISFNRLFLYMAFLYYVFQDNDYVDF